MVVGSREERLLFRVMLDGTAEKSFFWSRDDYIAWRCKTIREDAAKKNGNNKRVHLFMIPGFTFGKLGSEVAASSEAMPAC